MATRRFGALFEKWKILRGDKARGRRAARPTSVACVGATLRAAAPLSALLAAHDARAACRRR
jgi:hypothetical protein